MYAHIVTSCLFCYEGFETPMTKDVSRIFTSLKPKSSKWAYNDAEQRAVCRAHRIETICKPLARERSYPLGFDPRILKARVMEMKPEFDAIINGELQSPFQDTAVDRYRKLGRLRANNPMIMMNRIGDFMVM